MVSPCLPFDRVFCQALGQSILVSACYLSLGRTLRWGDGKVANFHMAFVCHASICMPQGCDRVQVVAFSIVRKPRSLMEGMETLCPHATISNHRWLPGTHSWLLSGTPDEWMHLSPFYILMHGEGLRYAKSTSQYSLAFSLKVRDDWGFPYVVKT